MRLGRHPSIPEICCDRVKSSQHQWSDGLARCQICIPLSVTLKALVRGLGSQFVAISSIPPSVILRALARDLGSQSVAIRSILRSVTLRGSVRDRGIAFDEAVPLHKSVYMNFCKAPVFAVFAPFINRRLMIISKPLAIDVMGLMRLSIGLACLVRSRFPLSP